MPEMNNKSVMRKSLREKLVAMTPQDRHSKSLAACALITASPEFAAAHTVMLYLSTPLELDTASLALRAWQAGKTVVVPKVSWDQRRMLPVEISSLTNNITTTGPGVLEPLNGNPIPLDFIDFVIVPGLGFSATGQRIGRGMGFYDRFLAQPEFIGQSCGLAFEDQVVDNLPTLDHDISLSMLATDWGIRRFVSSCIGQK